MFSSYASDHPLVAQNNQVQIAREAEARNTVGAINRSQQAYHFEKEKFTTTIRNLGIFPSSYYYVEIVKADRHQAIVIAKAKKNKLYRLRSFAGLIQYNPNKPYKSIICQTNSPSYSISLPIDAETCGIGSNLFHW